MTQKFKVDITTMSNFKAFNDPAHGWIKVPKALLEVLGIADKITPYSYMNGGFAYLEEDCDATLFVKVFEEKNGKKPKFTDHYCNGRSRIRQFESYRKN